MPVLFQSVSPKTCIMSRCRTLLKMRKTRAKRKMRKKDAAGRKWPNLTCSKSLIDTIAESRDAGGHTTMGGSPIDR